MLAAVLAVLAVLAVAAAAVPSLTAPDTRRRPLPVRDRRTWATTWRNYRKAWSHEPAQLLRRAGSRRPGPVPAVGLLAAAVLAAALAGCSAPPAELGQNAARQLQSQVLAVTEAAAANDRCRLAEAAGRTCDQTRRRRHPGRGVLQTPPEHQDVRRSGPRRPHGAAGRRCGSRSRRGWRPNRKQRRRPSARQQPMRRPQQRPPLGRWCRARARPGNQGKGGKAKGKDKDD